MANGASADEYLKRARAFVKKINPNLPQPYGDISDYLVYPVCDSTRESHGNSHFIVYNTFGDRVGNARCSWDFPLFIILYISWVSNPQRTMLSNSITAPHDVYYL